jgi:3-phosphoinositide dependent protein kinase-1
LRIFKNKVKKIKLKSEIMESSRRRTENDFQFGRAIGEGSFSTVYVARDLETKKEFASKYKKSHRRYFYE